MKEGNAVSLFAARDAARSRLVLILINRSSSTTVAASVELKGCGPVAASRLFSYKEGAEGLQPGALQSIRARTGTGVSARLPSYSISVIELKLGAAAE